MRIYLFYLRGYIYIRIKGISKVKFSNDLIIDINLTNIFLWKLIRRSNYTDKISTTSSKIKAFCTDKSFMLLATSYGLTVGASYAVGTLLAQITVPVFKMHDEVIKKKYIYIFFKIKSLI